MSIFNWMRKKEPITMTTSEVLERQRNRFTMPSWWEDYKCVTAEPEWCVWVRDLSNNEWVKITDDNGRNRYVNYLMIGVDELAPLDRIYTRTEPTRNVNRRL